MALNAAQLMVNIGANPAGAIAGIEQVSGMMGAGGMLPMAALGAGAVMVGVGIAATKMAADFQSQLTSLVTGAGESQKNLAMVHDGVLQLSKDTGTSTKQLIDGLYMIESGGYHGKAGLDILKAAAEGAKVGNADLGVVADATDTILKNYGQTGLTAAQSVNTLISTVAHGKTHMEDLASALSQVLPTGAAAGVGLNDVMAAMSTMTGEGVPAAEAATYLRQTIIALMAPSDGAKKALASIGLTSAQVSDEMHKSLPGAMQMIHDALVKKFPEGSAAYIAAMREIAGGSRQMQGMLDLGGSHIKTFAENVKTIGGAAADTSGKIAGWDLVQKTANQQFSRAVESVKALFIQLGEHLLPAVTTIAGWFADHLPGAIKTFQTSVGPVVKVIGDLINSITGNKALMDGLKDSFERLKPAIGPILTGLAVLTAISFAPLAIATAVVLGLFFALTHIPEIAGVVGTALGNLFGTIGDFFGSIFGAIGDFFGNVFGAIGDFAGSVGDAIGDFFSRTGAAIQLGINTVRQTVANTINTILNLFRDLYQHNHYVRDMVRGIQIEINSVRTFLTNAITAIKNWLLGQWQAIQQGTQAAWTLVQQRIIQPVQQAWGTIVQVFGRIGGWFHDRFTEVANRAHEGWMKFLGIITGLKNTVTSTIHDHIVQPIIDKITSLGPTMLAKGRDIISNLLNGIIGGLKNFANMNMAGAGKVLGFLGFDQATINSLPHFASGGTMGYSGLALVGENGPELVHLPGGAQIAPLPAGSGGGYGGSQTIVVQLVADGRKLAEVTAQHLPHVVRTATGNHRL